ncbi:MAG TPA: heavy metal translocating P-type ATPase [Verrucomicrobiae bacterium]|nr:heavy metal translocating P-type ATPase [Verrucomicrobiae bacterium]
MSKPDANAKSPEAAAAPPPDCLVECVAEVFAQEPGLEAVRIDRAHRSISVATLGRPNTAEIELAVTHRLNQLAQHESDGAEHCALLEGASDCSSCSHPARQDPGRRLTVQHDADATTIARVTCPTAPTFWRWRAFPWPKLVPREVRLPDEGEHEHEWKLQLGCALLCGLFGLAAYLSRSSPSALFLYLLSYVAGGCFTVREIWERLRHGALDVHFLMLAVAVGSASIGAWSEGAMLLFLFSLSGALEHYAMGRTSREIRSLFKAAPKSAIVLDAQGRESARPIEQIEPGVRLLIKPGEQFPVDAEVVSGATAADESNLTGEAGPVEKKIGDTVLAGTLNMWGAVEALALRRASQSALQRIIQLIQEAQHLKAPAQRFTDKFGTPYTYGILALTVVLFFVWWKGFGAEPFTSSATGKSAFYRAMALLVVASPCALVLSIPSAVLAAIAWGARRGILFRGGAAVEQLADTTVVAMDKTGTLTTGDLRVETVESFPPGREAEVARLAYSLERLSTHPLARAITRYGKHRQLTPLGVERIESVTGSGLRAEWDGAVVRLGKRGWVLEAERGQFAAPTTAPGCSEVWVAHSGLLGRLVLHDDLRPQARGVVEQLRALRLRTIVLTGDRQAAADHLKTELAVDEVRAELKPEQKVEVIRSLAAAGERVAMIGDGVNDAPSLAMARVGVAMGARGSDAALEQAAVVLMHDRLENFLTAFQLSCRARAIIRQNLIVSLGTVVVLVACALVGIIPLTVGVLGHEGSTVIVVSNSLRLLFLRKSG